ncbi:MAG: glutathione peroxidase [Chitinophagales bacterium]
MKKYAAYLLFCFLLIACGGSPEIVYDNFSTDQTIYQFSVKSLYGEEFYFSSLKGQKIMIVNTASNCGLTPQYEELQELYTTYKDQNFTIIGFPANNFLSQEPGSNEEIATFCEMNYGVEFPMMSKLSVKGSEQHQVYQFLTNASLNGFEDSDVKWNFQKYLIGEEGKVEKVIAPSTKPLDEEIINWIEE